MKKTAQKDGFIETEGGAIYYKIIGDGAKLPLLVIPGGPGLPSLYLASLETLAAARPVIFFDPLWCGNSKGGEDKTHWSLENSLAEITFIRNALGLEQCHIYGHSYGGSVALEHALCGAAGIESLILSSALISVPRWAEDTITLRKQLPQALQETLDTHEKNGALASDEYQGAMFEFYQTYFSRRKPWSDHLMHCFQNYNFDIFTHMIGALAIKPDGLLKDYDRSAGLHAIDIPTLLICGEYDQVTADATREYQERINGAKFQMIRDAAHMTMDDNPAEHHRALEQFLNGIR